MTQMECRRFPLKLPISSRIFPNVFFLNLLPILAYYCLYVWMPTLTVDLGHRTGPCRQGSKFAWWNALVYNKTVLWYIWFSLGRVGKVWHLHIYNPGQVIVSKTMKDNFLPHFFIPYVMIMQQYDPAYFYWYCCGYWKGHLGILVELCTSIYMHCFVVNPVLHIAVLCNTTNML